MFYFQTLQPARSVALPGASGCIPVTSVTAVAGTGSVATTVTGSESSAGTCVRESEKGALTFLSWSDRAEMSVYAFACEEIGLHHITYTL